jgi:hypothetical protein
MKTNLNFLKVCVFTLASMFYLSARLLAQAPPLVTTQESPRATVSQTIGITNVTIMYNRPSVKGRKVWGNLVPYNQVWRAGANENTVIEFSTPVKVEGKELTAGKYGLHMLPTEQSWTVIFNKNSSNWGSFSYDEKDDALRVTVTPQEGSQQEQLRYTFDGVSKNAGVLTLAWEKLQIPVKIETATDQLVLEDIRNNYLHGLGQFFAQGWSQAAAYCAQNQLNQEEAMAWVDKSIGMNANFNNLSTKSQLLRQTGKTQEAEAMMQQALAVANEVQAGKTAEAIAIFQKNVKLNPNSWNVYDSLAEAYGKIGDTKNALKLYQKALGMARDEQQK